jgi:hypothetical protein
MNSRGLPQTNIVHPIYLLGEILIKLFTLGIFSVESGAKAYFELILVIAALCASGYILWWQIPLLLMTIIFGTLAAGMFSVLAPQYLSGPNSIEPDKLILKSLKKISEDNLEEISKLSGQLLEDRLTCFYKAQKILEEYSDLVANIVELDKVLDNIRQSRYKATDKIEIEIKEEAYRRKQSEELEKQHEANNVRLRKEEEDRNKKLQEDYQEKIRHAAEFKAQQEKQRKEAQAAKTKENDEQKRIWSEWVKEQRRQEKFTGGFPPDDAYDPPRCRPNYPIKVTLNKTPDGFDGIIWHPSDSRYETVQPKWCYSSVDEALRESGQYRFRRPKRR